MQRTWRLIVLSPALIGLLSAGCAQFGSFAMPGRTAKPVDREGALAGARYTERNGSPEHAEQIYRNMQKQNAKDPTLEHRLGVIAAKQGRLDEARQHFQKAIDSGSKSAELMADLGYCCYLMDDLAGAEKALRSALDRDPHNRRARNNLGLVIGEQGRFDESLAQFKQAGSEAEAHANLAYVHTQLGQLQAATEEYNLALGLNQNLRPAAQALVQLAKDEPAREKARQLALSRHRPTQSQEPGSRPVERLASVQQPAPQVIETRPASPATLFAPPPPAVAMSDAPRTRPMAMEVPARPAPANEPAAAQSPERVVTVAHAVPVVTVKKPAEPARIAAPPAQVVTAPASRPTESAAKIAVAAPTKQIESPVPQVTTPAPKQVATTTVRLPEAAPQVQPRLEKAPAASRVQLVTVSHERLPAVEPEAAPVTEAASLIEAAPPAVTEDASLPVNLNDYRLDSSDSQRAPLFSRGLGRSYNRRR